MSWSNVGTPVKLDIDWQFTEPTNGVFFRFKHENAPHNAIYEIAQVELNDDDSYTLFDSQVLTYERGFDDTIKLAKLGIFTQRRLAIRRIPIRPTFEQEIRRLLLPGYLQSTDIPPTGPARNRWQVQIESSDYVEPSATVDLTSIYAKLDALSSKLDNLQSSGSGSTTSTTSKTLTYSSNGDSNGVCYWIGTNYGSQTWENPHTAGRLTCSLSTSYDGNDPPGNLVDRQNNQRPCTQNVPDSWMMLDLGISQKLICKYYSLKGRDYVADHLRSWKLQASNDAITWVDLDNQINNVTINQNTWFSDAITSTIAYRYFRVIQTGLNNGNSNIMSLAEWEFYGELIK